MKVQHEATAHGNSTVNVNGCIERFLTELADDSDPAAGLVREHLEQARFYWLESAAEEYDLTLKMAEQLLSGLANRDLRTRLGGFLKQARTAEMRVAG